MENTQDSATAPIVGMRMVNREVVQRVAAEGEQEYPFVDVEHPGGFDRLRPFAPPMVFMMITVAQAEALGLQYDPYYKTPDSSGRGPKVLALITPDRFRWFGGKSMTVVMVANEEDVNE